MAIVITNGQHYMKYNEKGVLKGTNFNDAVKFESLKAAKKAYRGLKSCNKNFIIYDTALHKVLYSEQDQGKDQLRVLNNKFDGNTPAICKRKGFGVKQRKQIYKKTEGHCYLCGDFVDFDSFEIEHRIPRSKGGTNDIENLYCSCHICNLIKHDIYPQDFNERITKIFMHQMEIKYSDKWLWRWIKQILEVLI
nr:MAG TPA: HNHc [Caudoviricetes sp.]